MRVFPPFEVVYDFHKPGGIYIGITFFEEQFDSDYQKPKTCSLFDLLIPPLYSVLRQMNLKKRLKFMHKSLCYSIIYKQQSIIYNSRKVERTYKNKNVVGWLS